MLLPLVKCGDLTVRDSMLKPAVFTFLLAGMAPDVVNFLLRRIHRIPWMQPARQLLSDFITLSRT